MDILALEQTAKRVRSHILQMVSSANSSHVGTALSVVEILVALYFVEMSIDPQSLTDPERDIFILSKGHGSAALYAVLAEFGCFGTERLNEYYADAGHMPGHPAYRCVPGVEASTGSLGHGLAIALGQAVAQRSRNSPARTFTLLGDGECNEGTVWEAAMYASHLGVSNLVSIVDCNGLQGFGRTQEVSSIEPLADKWAAFGWAVLEADGHNLFDIVATLEEARRTTRPTVILARTVKGKGISFMEDRLEWHYKSPNPAQLRSALRELGI